MDLSNEMNQEAYLSRLGIASCEYTPDVNFLRQLQQRHLLSVPFENLDIHWKRPITLDAESFYRKVVLEKRGGFCYELNGLFNELLRGLGFNTRLVSARVFGGEAFSPEFAHAAIIVTIGELKYLVDVGFGDFTVGPLRLVPDIEQRDREGDFMIRGAEFGLLEVAKKGEGSWKPEYRFEPQARDLSEFAQMCDFQQYSPESHFTKNKLCSILTADGRKTLAENKYIVTSGGQKTETPVGSEQEFDAILMREFSISRNT